MCGFAWHLSHLEFTEIPETVGGYLASILENSVAFSLLAFWDCSYTYVGLSGVSHMSYSLFCFITFFFSVLVRMFYVDLSSS